MKHIVLFLALCLLPSVALAEGAASDVMNGIVFPVATAVLTLAFAALIGFATDYIRKKTGIELSKDTQEKAEQAALKAVRMVEEMAKAKTGNTIEKWDGKLKESKAIEYARQFIPDLTQAKAEQLVKWAVAATPGIGATLDQFIGGGDKESQKAKSTTAG